MLNIPTNKLEDGEKTIYTEYTPLGVCAGIVPWNFPLVLAVGKVVPALLTDNAIILKPSLWTPYTGLKVVEMMQQYFPAGLVQAVGGSDALGAEMCEHPGIAKTSFTGSTATGKEVTGACAKALKRVALKLGGNDASIILSDIDIKEVARAVVMGAFHDSGQVCVATKRIYIHKSIYSTFLGEMFSVTKTIKLGPIQNSMQYEKIRAYHEEARAKGFTFAVGTPDIAAGHHRWSASRVLHRY